MLRIVYMSRVAGTLSPQEFDELIEVSFARNGRDGITGLLLFDGRRWLQAIEGEEGPTRACYGRIRRDTRHHDIVTMEEAAINRREFGQWSLKAYDLLGGQGSFRDEVMAAVAGVDAPAIRAMFIGFTVLLR